MKTLAAVLLMVLLAGCTSLHGRCPVALPSVSPVDVALAGASLLCHAMAAVPGPTARAEVPPVAPAH